MSDFNKVITDPPHEKRTRCRHDRPTDRNSRKPEAHRAAREIACCHNTWSPRLAGIVGFTRRSISPLGSQNRQKTRAVGVGQRESPEHATAAGDLRGRAERAPSLMVKTVYQGLESVLEYEVLNRHGRALHGQTDRNLDVAQRAIEVEDCLVDAVGQAIAVGGDGHGIGGDAGAAQGPEPAPIGADGPFTARLAGDLQSNMRVEGAQPAVVE